LPFDQVSLPFLWTVALYWALFFARWAEMKGMKPRQGADSGNDELAIPAPFAAQNHAKYPLPIRWAVAKS
jgi:hypothetical protein